jgi:ribosomal protein S27E
MRVGLSLPRLKCLVTAVVLLSPTGGAQWMAVVIVRMT